VGIFFEDLSYAADGGLYAELVHNRSFAYNTLARREWNSLTAWELVERRVRGTVPLDGSFPLHRNNPHYAVLELRDAGEAALVNAGFDGIPVRAGEIYDLSFFARRLYAGGRWDGRKPSGSLPVLARLEAKDGAVLAESAFEIVADKWIRLGLTSTNDSSADADAKLPDHFAFSTVRDSASGDLMLKLVNGSSPPCLPRIERRGLPRLPAQACLIVFTAPDADIANEDAAGRAT
jgi:hypothetical protein